MLFYCTTTATTTQASYIPQLAMVDPEQFSISFCSVDGTHRTSTHYVNTTHAPPPPTTRARASNDHHDHHNP